jgi:hypothetical protein
VVASREEQITETFSSNHHEKEQPRTGKNAGLLKKAAELNDN